MKPWKCQICGETYLGEEPADRCPYCGADGKNLISPAEYIDFDEDIEMCEQSRNDCLKALGFENNNVSFYRKCANNAENQITESIFKRLGKQESEHAEVFEEMLDIEEQELPEVDIPDNDYERFEEAHEHEQRAINFYLKVARRAPEPRVKQVFRSLSEIEEKHLNLSNIYK